MPKPTRLRDDVTLLVRYAKADIAALLRQVKNPKQAEEALHDVLPALIAAYGTAAATIAADWYDDLRDAAAPRKAFRAIPADIRDSGAHSLIGWALNEAKDDASFESLLAGGTQRRIADFSRETVMSSSHADPASVGWKRIGAGACPFCEMLIDSDATYTEDTADFGSHDNCNCQAYPLISGAEPIDVKDYVKTTREITDKDRERVRTWIKENQ